MTLCDVIAVFHLLDTNVTLIIFNKHCIRITVNLQDIVKQRQILCLLLMCTTDACLSIAEQQTSFLSTCV